MSQLCPLTRHCSWTVFAPGLLQVSLSPATSHLGKNECVDHQLQPFVIPPWRILGGHHQLCPDWALHLSMSRTPLAGFNHVFVWSDSLHWYSSANIALNLKRVINAADQGNLQWVQEVCPMAATLVFLRIYSLDTIQQAGQ